MNRFLFAVLAIVAFAWVMPSGVHKPAFIDESPSGLVDVVIDHLGPRLALAASIATTQNTDIDAAHEQCFPRPATTSPAYVNPDPMTKCVKVIVKPATGNTGIIYVGTQTTDTNLNGFPLWPHAVSGGGTNSTLRADELVLEAPGRSAGGKSGDYINLREFYCEASVENQAAVAYCIGESYTPSRR